VDADNALEAPALAPVQHVQVEHVPELVVEDQPKTQPTKSGRPGQGDILTFTRPRTIGTLAW